MDTYFQRLLKNPNQFDFFQAVRLLQANASKQSGSNIGRVCKPDDEFVRFKVKDALSFPTTRVEQIFPRPNEKMTLIVSFLGLTGPGGVLPNHYTELMLQRRQVKDTSLLDFFDLFNHRTLSLLYRAWEKYRPHLNLERHCFITMRDPLTQVLASLNGIENFNLPPHQAVFEKSLIHQTQFLMQLSRSAFTLSELLKHYFQLPIQVKQFQGSWLLLDERDQTCLAKKGTQGISIQLGVNTVLGTRVWDLQTKFRLVIGPLSLRKFNELAPSGKLCQSLKHLTRIYAGPILNFDLEITLKAEEIPYCILSSKSNQGLGWNTWLKSKNPENSSKGVVIIH